MKRNKLKGIILMFIIVIVCQGALTSFAQERNKKVVIEKKIYCNELKQELVIFPTVFDGVSRGQYVHLLKQDFSWAKNVLDIGTGCGILGFIALKQGAAHVVGTDINPHAVDNARYNAKLLGYENFFEARLVSHDNRGAFAVIKDDEKFDVIISNPPGFQGSMEELSDSTAAKYDPGFVLLKTLLDELHLHLNKRGKLILYLGGDNIAFVKEYVKDKNMLIKEIHEPYIFFEITLK